MKKGIRFIAILLILTLFAGFYSSLSIKDVSAAVTTYYVSPNGNDLNPGTEAEPWKTLRKAASSLRAGDTAIFEDGTYEETSILIFSSATNGMVNAPITLKSRNKHGAVIKFTGVVGSKIAIHTKESIIIQAFEITQTAKSTSSGDILIDITNSSNCKIIGNKIHNAFGKAVRCQTNSRNITIDQNVIYNIDRESITIANADAPVISNNNIYEVGNGIILAAGTRSARVYNNYIHTSDRAMLYGIVLGGSYAAVAAYDSAGFEAYNSVAWNNKIISETPAMIGHGLVFMGSKDCGFLNNIVIGADYGIYFIRGGGIAAGWSWDPMPTNPVYKNNIIQDCVKDVTHVNNSPVNLDNDYNLYYNSPNAPEEVHGVYADPQFINPLSDWNFQQGSPAIGLGTPVSFTDFSGASIDISRDYNGTQRVEPWDMGIYAVGLPIATPSPDPTQTPTPEPTSTPTPTPSPTPMPDPVITPPPLNGQILYSDDFEDGNWDGWTAETGSIAVIKQDNGNYVLTEPGTSGSTLSSKASTGSLDWNSYSLELNVKFDEFFGDNRVFTIYSRYIDSRNYYLVELRNRTDSQGYIALKKKVDGTVIPLQEKIYPVSTNNWYNLKMVVDGSDIKIYIDDKLELSGTDNQLSNGRIALAIFRMATLVDNVKVTEIKSSSTEPTPEPTPRPTPGGTYYVSPVGSDRNPGSETAPWKTFSKAAAEAQRGDTIIFEDGEYIETQAAIFQESGTENEPITLKARNKHKAVIKYQSMPTMKIYIKGKEHITIQDFEITQDQKGGTTDDIIIHCREGSNYNKFIGNKIHNAYEEGIKCYLVKGILIEGNIIYDMVHEGIDFVSVDSSIMRNNELYELARCGLLAKGGSKSIQIYNNYIHNKDANMFIGGIVLGGLTGGAYVEDPSGYEAYNMTVWNNVIVAETPGMINYGIGYIGSIDCSAYNNIVIGPKYGIYMSNSGGDRYEWTWDPIVTNPVFKNNIIMNCTSDVVKIADPSINQQNDYNLYYNSQNSPIEPHGIYSDPLFMDINGDWHLSPESPAVGVGTEITNVVGYFGEIIDVSYTFDGVKREGLWDLGIYNQQQPIDEIPPTTTVDASGIQSGEWFISDVAITFSAADDSSAVRKTEYSTDAGISWNVYTAPVIITEEGSLTLHYHSEDNSGNVEATKSLCIKVDKTRPIIDLTVNGISLEDGDVFLDSQLLKFNLYAVDELSGINCLHTSINGLPLENGQELDFTGKPGEYQVVITSYDKAGNLGELKVTFEIVTSYASMIMLIDCYTTSGDISESVVDRLKKDLEISQSQYDKGYIDQAVKHLEDFLRSIEHAYKQNDNKNMKKISVNSAKILTKDAEYLIQKLIH